LNGLDYRLSLNKSMSDRTPKILFRDRLPHSTVVLAMSADGKIADVSRAPARFGSAIDQAHLEQQVAQADAVLFGAGTLRAYGTTLKVSHSDLLAQRHYLGKPPQPVQIVCSRSSNLDPTWRFFSQPVPRWLLTTQTGKRLWGKQAGFEQVLASGDLEINWLDAFTQLFDLGLQRLAILGGGELVSALFAADLIDELHLTLCPLILGGTQSPTPVAGSGFLAAIAPQLELLNVRSIDQEVFLHYKVKHP
jgi:5-amino-6-(5-phosphoribosylamino)uracil reductase